MALRTGMTGSFEDVADAYVDVVCYMGICLQSDRGCLRQTCVQ
jgi:hypothetical protein